MEFSGCVVGGLNKEAGRVDHMRRSLNKLGFQGALV